MSYEGYDQNLCTKGHLHCFDAYQFDAPNKCPDCGSPWVWRHQVDQTNGYDPEDPGTYPVKLEEVGFEDEWHTDHYGTRYATKKILYKIPDNPKERLHPDKPWLYDEVETLCDVCGGEMTLYSEDQACVCPKCVGG